MCLQWSAAGRSQLCSAERQSDHCSLSAGLQIVLYTCAKLSILCGSERKCKGNVYMAYRPPHVQNVPWGAFICDTAILRKIASCRDIQGWLLRLFGFSLAQGEEEEIPWDGKEIGWKEREGGFFQIFAFRFWSWISSVANWMHCNRQGSEMSTFSGDFLGRSFSQVRLFK